MNTGAAYFTAIYDAVEDPFGYRTRWYERRKRDLLLAALPAPRYRSGWELGCSIGELTGPLSDRCDALLATDLSAEAVARARRRLAGREHVAVRQANHPDEWPPDTFDLIVFSEIGYYFERPVLEAIARRLRRSLESDGTLVACHWRHPFSPAPLIGEQVHRLLAEVWRQEPQVHYEDADFVLDLWCSGQPSVAEREALR